MLMIDKRKIKGITLIALVVSIIIILIIASVAISLTVGNNGIITRTESAVREYEISAIKEKLSLQLEKDEIKSVRYMNTDEVDKLINNNRYKGKIGIYRENLIYLGNEQDDELQYMKERGFEIINMTPDEFKYYIELGVLEDVVKENNIIVGRELQTNEFGGTIKIGDNTYGIGWFLIGNYTEQEKNNNTYQNQFEKLGLKDTNHSPYLVNYETGVVLSIEGMVMYQSQVIVHSFNDNYDEYLASAITYVNSFTEKTGESYGNLISTSLYTGRIENYGGGMSIYTDNNGLLEYDEKGALILDSDNAIPVLEIDNKFKIEESYSINVTIEGDYMQANIMPVDGYANTIVALSDTANRYLSWIGVYKGYLQVYAYYTGSPLKDITSEITRVGFTSIDLSPYLGETINIQVVATRGENAIIYINGSKVRTFEVGDNKLTFQYTTLGDLRVGRNLKFVGKIYEFGIYRIAINEAGIQKNWERAKKYVE